VALGPRFRGDEREVPEVFRISNETELPKSPLDQLYRRPGFMIRRAHQIAVSMFLEETGELGITNRQYGIMLVLRHQPGIDQITVAKLLGLDRSTTGMVLGKLEDAGLVGRVVGAKDRRKRSLKLTPAGERMLARLAGPARRAQERVLSAFSPRERKMFLDLLEKFARAFNDTTRVPQVVQSVDEKGRAKKP
jgi:DNA-binding MarR family transcriptional regulator